MNTIQFVGETIAPSKIVCIGRNYVAHAKELGNETPKSPVIFIKPNSSVGSELNSQHQEETLHYESEISFLVKQGRLAGLGIGLDLTKRDTQQSLKEKGLPWERAKSFDGSALFSEFISLDGIDITELAITLSIDGKLIQDGGVEMMLFPPVELIKEVSTFLTIEDGDILMTGTPAGVGPVVRGSHFQAEIKERDRALLAAEWIAR